MRQRTPQLQKRMELANSVRKSKHHKLRVSALRRVVLYEQQHWSDDVRQLPVPQFSGSHVVLGRTRLWMRMSSRLSTLRRDDEL